MSKKFSKILTSVLVICISVNFTACSSSSTPSSPDSPSNVDAPSEQILLTMWHYYNNNIKDILDSQIQEFNETIGKEKNIIVDAYAYPSIQSLPEAVLASATNEIGAADMPDIFYAYADNALALDELGIVANLNDYFTDAELSLYRAEFLEEGRFDAEQNLKILPVSKSTEALFINRTDFDAFAADTGKSYDLSTWQGLASTAEAYYNYTDAKTDTPNDGYALFGLDGFANTMIISAKQLGEDIYTYDNGSVTFNLTESSAKLIWENLITPYVKGHFAAYGRFRSDDIKSGDLLAYTGSTASALFFPDEVIVDQTNSYGIDHLIMPYPVFQGADNIMIQQGAGIIITPSNAERERAAVEFVKWLSEPEQNIEFAVATGYIPVYNESLNYDAIIDSIEDTTSIVASVSDVVYNDMLVNYQAFTLPPFENSYSIRIDLDAYIQSHIDDTITTLDNFIANGVHREDALNNLLSEERFSQWYTGLKDTIEK
ncbi:MAG: hypothetical protein BEN19_06900 [Epulopiscium sp. Nuni2H_MBin003]|nr:MAG: hypothetical protein BEN19_06900 [Epulopiscium sp. Nuni2H_MBin003]